MEMQGSLLNQVLLAVVDRGKSAFLVAANIRQSADAVFRVQVGLGQSNQIQLFNGTGNSKFLSWVNARLSSDLVISVTNQGTWTLAGCRPTHYKGPTLGTKGGSVAMEELTVSHEGIMLDK